MPKKSPYAAPALDRGLDILEHLAAVGIPQSQTEIAEAIGCSQPELFRMLARLEARSYVLRDAQTSRYALSLKLYHLSHTHSPIDSLSRAAMPTLRNLASICGHPAHLCVLDRDALLVVTQVRGPHPVSLSIEEGSRFPIETTASGRVLLACLSEPERNALLTQSQVFPTWSKTRQRKYLASLAAIRADRYLYTTSEITQGVSDVSALIGKVDGPVLGTVAVSCVSSLLGSSTDPERLIDFTLKAAAQISRDSGIQP